MPVLLHSWRSVGVVWRYTHTQGQMFGLTHYFFAVSEAYEDQTTQAISVHFAFACGVLISALLLVNAGRAYPACLPITVAIGYFWFVSDRLSNDSSSLISPQVSHRCGIILPSFLLHTTFFQQSRWQITGDTS